MDTTEQLLFNIWQELKRINTPQAIPHEATEMPQTKEIKANEYVCKVENCGFKTQSKGLYLAHCKKHKREGV